MHPIDQMSIFDKTAEELSVYKASKSSGGMYYGVIVWD